MTKTDLILQILEQLIESGVVTVETLAKDIDLSNEQLMYILRDLEFLNIVNVRKRKVYLSSHAYSLLFDVLVASRGLRGYIERCFQKRVVREIKTIPGLLVPILLLRAAIPYFGLILRDLERKGEIQLDKNKLDLLFEYFSRRKMDYYSSYKNWENIDFELDEFYDIWIMLNKEISKRIKIRDSLGYWEPPKESEISKHPPPVVESPLSSTNSESGVDVSGLILGIPKENLKMLFGVSEVIKGKTQILKTRDQIPSNLIRIKEIAISLENMRRFIQEYRSKTKGLLITIYDKGLKWEFRGEKIKVPTMFLLEDGIYVDEETDRRFSGLEKSNQVHYLEDCVKASEKL